MDYASLAAEIVTHMPGWSVDPPSGHELGWRWAQISDGTHRITLNAAGKSGRLCLCGRVPTHTRSGQYVPSAGPSPEITVSADRPAASIAAEITRRLLPDLRKLHAQQVAILQEWSTAEDLREAAAVALSTYGRRGGSMRKHTISLYHRDNSDCYGDIEVNSSSSVRMELHVKPEVAAQIAKLLKDGGHIS